MWTTDVTAHEHTWYDVENSLTTSVKKFQYCECGMTRTMTTSHGATENKPTLDLLGEGVAMTALPDPATLEGVELAEAIALEVMGWLKLNNNIGLWRSKDGEDHYILDADWSASNDFRPDLDHNHAAEVRARMCELYPDYVWRIQVYQGVRVCFYHKDAVGAVAVVDAQSETIAVCRVALIAHRALAKEPK